MAGTMNWDAVVASAPNDKTASIVRDGSGERYQCDRIESMIRDGGLSRLPMPLVANPPGHPEFVDLTGAVCGRFTVLGLLDRPVKSSGVRGARWVIRCVCGNYEARRTPVLKRQLAGEDDGQSRDCCAECGMQRHRQWLQTKEGRESGKPMNLLERSKSNAETGQ